MDVALARQHSWFRRSPGGTQREAKDLARPGWFPDPADISHERFWTGSIWTGLVRPISESYSMSMAGMSRTFFDHSISSTSVRTRRLVASEESIRWGRFHIRLNDITSVTHWVESNRRDGHWERLHFSVEGRLGTMRFDIKGVKNSDARTRAYDGYRALVSASSAIIVPRLAVDIVNRLEGGHIVKLGSYRLTARGLSSRHVDPRRQALTGRWDSLELLVDPTGASLDTDIERANRGSVFVRTNDGVAFPHLDAHDRVATVMPLVLWLAKDRFAEKPLLLRA